MCWQVLHGPFDLLIHGADTYATSFLHLSVKGTTGFEAQIDKCLELAEYLYNKIKNREGYEMVFDGKVGSATSFFQLVNSICFITYWMLPTGQINHHETESRDPCNKTSCGRGSSSPLPHGMQGQGR